MEGRGSLKKEHRRTQLVMVDDHDLARDSLRDMLADEPDLEVVGEAANGREALTLCSRLHPDLVLMDVRMPVMDGLQATREIERMHPKASVLMLTMHGCSGGWPPRTAAAELQRAEAGGASSPSPPVS